MSTGATARPRERPSFEACLQYERERLARREPNELANWLAELVATNAEPHHQGSLSEWQRFFHNLVARQRFRIFITGERVPDQGGRAIALALRHAIRGYQGVSVDQDTPSRKQVSASTPRDVWRPQVLVLMPSAERVCRAATAVRQLTRFQRHHWACLKVFARHERLQVSMARCQALAQTTAQHKRGVVVLGTPHRIAELLHRRVLGAPQLLLVLDMSLDEKCRRLLRMPDVERAVVECLWLLREALEVATTELVLYA
ncbi:hypothetical protein CCYA_CCYA09G2741 [Cyanidiococcus yangmingshanensis]|uniref:Uncharacterized protein n=1 Tax=Cyanidiococcus yangmingshanensis TaxID=2690220 RepID=A0A7J7IKU9_9RHOD|nr:hypothetical protein F1559_004627 [Cyanidiococcus yangmingshanensis]KAK4531884.1 hypothetical protein CCYA_CCYA09G2741 [Cyanidiococcus yangmingshanensis]